MNPARSIPAAAVLLLLALAGPAVAQRDSIVVGKDGREVRIVLPGLPEALAVGRRAPRITGVDLDGAPVRAGRRSTVYFFSFQACAPCARLLDRIAAADWQLKDGARLVYLNSMDRPERLRPYLERKYGSAAFDVLLLDAETRTRLRIESYPTVVVVDASGRIIFNNEDVDDPEAVLRAILATYAPEPERA